MCREGLEPSTSGSASTTTWTIEEREFRLPSCHPPVRRCYRQNSLSSCWDTFHGESRTMNRFHKMGLIVLAAAAIAGVSVQTIGAAPATATIEVRKMLVPSNDPGLWNLLVRYTGGPIITEVFNVSNNGHTPRVTIPAATWLTVEELQGTNTLLSNYSPVLNCFVVSGPDKGFAFPPVNLPRREIPVRRPGSRGRAGWDRRHRRHQPGAGDRVRAAGRRARVPRRRPHRRAPLHAFGDDLRGPRPDVGRRRLPENSSGSCAGWRSTRPWPSTGPGRGTGSPASWGSGLDVRGPRFVLVYLT